MIFKDIEWKNYKGVLLPVTPQHQPIGLTNKEQKEILKLSKAYLIKWVNEWDCSKPTNYWYVIKDSFGEFAELSSNMRNQIRKGLKLCEVKMTDADFIINNGYEIFKNAHIQYQKKSNILSKIPTEDSFKNTYNKIATTSAFLGSF